MAWQNYLSNYMRKQQEADQWRDFHNRFMELACEEQGRAVAITNGETLRRMDRVLRAYCDYHKHPEVWAEKGKPGQGFFCLLKAPEAGLWMYGDGVSDNFRERVRVFVTRAGVALGPPKGIDAEDFWLHRLYLDMLENNSKLLLCESSQRTNTILSVCVASATFCSRLERKALEQSEPGGAKVPSQVGERAIGEPAGGQRLFDPNENFQNAICQKEARIAGIERTLSRPLPTEYRGQPVHGGEASRLRLEEEKQHLLMAVRELEAEAERTAGIKKAQSSPAQNSHKTAQVVANRPPHGASGNTAKTAKSGSRAKKITRHPPARTVRRARCVSRLLRELQRIKPKMHNESRYAQVSREHRGYLIFKIAQENSDVREWIENVQDRRGLVGLAQEIAARHHKVSLATVKTDWSHRKAHR